MSRPAPGWCPPDWTLWSAVFSRAWPPCGGWRGRGWRPCSSSPGTAWSVPSWGRSSWSWPSSSPPGPRCSGGLARRPSSGPDPCSPSWLRAWPWCSATGWCASPAASSAPVSPSGRCGRWWVCSRPGWRSGRPRGRGRGRPWAWLASARACSTTPAPTMSPGYCHCSTPWSSMPWAAPWPVTPGSGFSEPSGRWPRPGPARRCHVRCTTACCRPWPWWSVGPLTRPWPASLVTRNGTCAAISPARGPRSAGLPPHCGAAPTASRRPSTPRWTCSSRTTSPPSGPSRWRRSRERWGRPSPTPASTGARVTWWSTSKRTATGGCSARSRTTAPASTPPP